MIELRTLGALELGGPESGAVDALISQPKRLALLIYIAAARPTGFHRRDTLLSLFWPELDQTHARGALRNALSFLRRQLGEAAIVTRGDEAWPSGGVNTPRRLQGLPWWLARGDTAAIARFALRAKQESKRSTTPRGKLRSDYLLAAAEAYLALARADTVWGARPLPGRSGNALYGELLLSWKADRGSPA